MRPGITACTKDTYTQVVCSWAAKNNREKEKVRQPKQGRIMHNKSSNGQLLALPF